MTFRIYHGDTIVAEGESPLAITGLEPNTSVSEGEYQATRVEGERESARVDIPAFTTLPIPVTGVSVTPRTSTAEAGTAGNRQLTVVIEPPNATNQNVTFTITPSAPGLSVSDTGLITWTEETPAGVYVTEVKTEDGGFTATHTLTLTEPEEPPEDPENGD